MNCKPVNRAGACDILNLDVMLDVLFLFRLIVRLKLGLNLILQLFGHVLITISLETEHVVTFFVSEKRWSWDDPVEVFANPANVEEIRNGQQGEDHLQDLRGQHSDLIFLVRLMTFTRTLFELHNQIFVNKTVYAGWFVNLRSIDFYENCRNPYRDSPSLTP